MKAEKMAREHRVDLPPKPFCLGLAVALLVVAGCGGGGGGGGATPSTFSISGTVTGAASVTVNLAGPASGSTTTDANGNYAFGSLGNGTYLVTPSKTGYTFNPGSIAVTVAGGNVTGQSFAAILSTYTVSGAVSGAVADGVLIMLGGATTSSTTTAGGGLYSFPGLVNGSYTLTPSKAGYSFAPGSITLTVSGFNAPQQNFTSTTLVSGVTGTCSVDNWCWRNPLPQGEPLNAVWGSGPGDVWSVGDFGTILHWNGSAWVGNSSGTTVSLHGVWGSGPTDVWTVGASGTILHWNGTAWASAASGTTQSLNGV